MKKFLLLLAAMWSLSMTAQRFDSPMCWFDNSSGQFLNVADRYVHPGMQPFAMYIVDKSHRVPITSQFATDRDVLTPNYQASAMVYVLPGKRLDDLKRMEKMFVKPVWDYLVRWAAETEASRKKGGGELFLFPVGVPEQIFIRGTEETVSFMGVDDAKRMSYVMDLGKSPMFLSLFNAQALQTRIHCYRYYDPAADKSALVILMQSGFDREYTDIDNELQAFAAMTGGLSSLLIKGNPANSEAVKDWLENSTWKDIQPDFERYFHLKPAGTIDGPKSGDPPPTPPEFPNDSTIVVIDSKGQRHTIGGLYPIPAPPVLIVDTLRKPIIDPEHPDDPKNPGQRMVFRDAIGLSEGGFHIAENDTATYFVATRQSKIYGLNKKTGHVTIDTTETCTPRQCILGAGCLKDGRLLIYQATFGVIDAFSHKVVIEDKNRYERKRMVVNPVTNRIYLYHRGELKEYDEQYRLLNTYQSPIPETEFCYLHLGRDGRLWIQLGHGYAGQAYTTLQNGKFTPVVEPEYSARVPLYWPYMSNATYLGARLDGLYEVSYTTMPTQLLAAEWRTLQGVVMNSKNEIFVTHDNRTLERFTTKGGVRSAEVYNLDFRFNRKGMLLFQDIYIDALDNLWISTGKEVFLWHPSGKINGYGDFNGEIGFGYE